MTYAIIQTGGKQYRVSEGDTIIVESLTSQPSETVEFDDVLLYVSDNGNAIVGTPTVKHAKVLGKVVNHVRGEKIRVAVFHAKVRHRKVRGHRQRLTTIRIERIEAKENRKPATTEKKRRKTAVAKK